MIAHLKGKILQKTDKGIIVDTGSVGYFVFLSSNYCQSLSIGAQIELSIHTHIREDALDLYGFASFEELAFFKKLISVNKVGPKLALEILNFQMEHVKAAIINDDSSFLSKIPGIGKKTAQKIIIDVKTKLDELEALSANYSLPSDTNQEVIEALEGLGYQRKHVLRKLQTLPENLKETEEIIRYFLKNA